MNKEHSPEEELNEMEISNSSDKEPKVIRIRMLNNIKKKT